MQAKSYTLLPFQAIKEDLWPSALQYFLGTLPNDKSRMDYEYETEYVLDLDKLLSVVW